MSTANRSEPIADLTGEQESCGWCWRPFDYRCERGERRRKCVACGVWTISPWPSSAELDSAYSSWYRPESGRFSGPGDRLLKLTRGRLANRLARLAPVGRILDVGAGDGSLLDSFAASGREAIGLERSANRPDLRDEDIAEIEGKWAAIVFWHSLEHLAKARQAISHAAAKLEVDGLVAIAVPNASSIQASVFKDRWLAIDAPRHLFHIPSEALLEALRQEGLTASRTSSYRGGQVLFGWLHGIVGMLPGRPSLYDAIRKPDARQKPMAPIGRGAVVFAGVALLPVAAVATAVEVAADRGGSFYVEAAKRPLIVDSPSRISGERVSDPSGGFNPTWQRHVAAYAEAAKLLESDAQVLDVGCGHGHSYELLAPRETVGVDLFAGALAGQQRPTVCADMRALPFPDNSYSSLCCIHAIEHVPDPELAVAEAARVLGEDGVAVYVTPNRLTFGRPDEIIDPFHFIEFDQHQLRYLCLKSFESVEIYGIFGSERLLKFSARERVVLDRYLGLDPLRIRRFVPLRVKQILYDLLLNSRRKGSDPEAEAITVDDFYLDSSNLDDCLDVVAVCTKPRLAS